MLWRVLLAESTALGLWAGSRVGAGGEGLRDPLGVVQGALLTLVALVLAFGLAMAVARHDARRSAVVDDANAIGTTYLRAQTLAEPQRSQSLALLREYTEESLNLSDAVPGSDDFEDAIAAESEIQRELWRLAGEALASAPENSAPRLYMESLNDMIDMQTTRAAALNSRVPSAIVLFEVVGAAVALALLALYLAVLSRGKLAAFLTAAVLTLLLFVSLDLDRPTRGFIQIPTAALTSLQKSMEDPPAAAGP
jgi:hypothetical protein